MQRMDTNIGITRDARGLAFMPVVFLAALRSALCCYRGTSRIVDAAY